jgi:hypothetical protein
VLAGAAPSPPVAAEATDLDWLKQPVRTIAARMAILLRMAALWFMEDSFAESYTGLLGRAWISVL